jgi:hypothetical protein
MTDDTDQVANLIRRQSRTLAARLRPLPVQSAKKEKAMKAAILALALSTAATAQPVNLDLNDTCSKPTNNFGAAGDQPGFWNVTNGFVGAPKELLGLDGAPSGVMLSFPIGFGAKYSIPNPFLVGELHTLLDDGLLTPDVVQTLRFEGLDPGTYDVYTYGPPVTEGLKTLFMYTSGDESEGINITGGWNGALEEGVNYAHTTIQVADATLDVEWVAGMFGDSGYFSGLQLVPAEGCAADVNGDGMLNILDFVAYQNLFVNADPAADCDANGVLNVLDFVCFQGIFQAGCP